MTDDKAQEPIKDELALHQPSISPFARYLIYQRHEAGDRRGAVDAVRRVYGAMLRGLVQARLH